MNISPSAETGKKTESETPRTDREMFWAECGGEIVPAYFAKQLERELNEALDRVNEVEIENTAHGYALSALRRACGLGEGELYSDIAEFVIALKTERDQLRSQVAELQKQIEWHVQNRGVGPRIPIVHIREKDDLSPQ